MASSKRDTYPPGMQRAIDAALAERGRVKFEDAPLLSAKARGQAPASPYRSELENDYAAHLNVLQASGVIVTWIYEGVTFNLGGGAKYKPDFMVLAAPDLEVTFYETKGFWRESHRVRIKVAAARFPWFRFVGITRNDAGEWEEETF